MTNPVCLESLGEEDMRAQRRTVGRPCEDTEKVAVYVPRREASGEPTLSIHSGMTAREDSCRRVRGEL